MKRTHTIPQQSFFIPLRKFEYRAILYTGIFITLVNIRSVDYDIPKVSYNTELEQYLSQSMVVVTILAVVSGVSIFDREIDRERKKERKKERKMDSRKEGKKERKDSPTHASLLDSCFLSGASIQAQRALHCIPEHQVETKSEGGVVIRCTWPTSSTSSSTSSWLCTGYVSLDERGVVL